MYPYKNPGPEPRLRAVPGLPDDVAGQLAGLLSQTEYVVLLADTRRRITYANERFSALSGLTAEALAASATNPFLFDSASPEDRQRFLSALDRGEKVRCELPLKAADGQVHHLALNIWPLRQGQQAITGWMALGHDVSDAVRLRSQFAAHEHRLQLTLESARMGTWEVNKRTDEIIVDDSWLGLAGIAPADRHRAGELWPACIHPDDRATMQARMAQAIDGSGDVETSQYRIYRADGTMLWIQDTSRVIERAADGVPLRIVGVVTDITGLKDALDQAERVADRLGLAAAAANLGIWDHDLLEGRYYWNERMREIHGLEGREESLQTYVAMTHPDDRVSLGAAIRAGSDSGKEFQLHFRIVRPDGEVRHIEVQSRMHKTADGRPWRAVGVTRDVTDYVRGEIERNQVRKLQAIGRLAAGIAHEINTPSQYVSENLRFVAKSLGSVTGLLAKLRAVDSSEALQVVLDGTMNDADTAYELAEIPRAIADSLEGMERITNIVRAMNDFSHPANLRVPIDINKAIASTVTVARSEWKGVAVLEADLDPALPFVAVMPGEFNQVMLNLIVNAAHAIAERSGSAPGELGRITIRTRQQGERAEILVADTGCGMSPEVQLHIFDPFFTTKPVGKGTGQGLALAHNIIMSHQGSITVQSRPGEGTSFTILLPLVPGEAR